MLRALFCCLHSTSPARLANCRPHPESFDELRSTASPPSPWHYHHNSSGIWGQNASMFSVPHDGAACNFHAIPVELARPFSLDVVHYLACVLRRVCLAAGRWSKRRQPPMNSPCALTIPVLEQRPQTMSLRFMTQVDALWSTACPPY